MGKLIEGIWDCRYCGTKGILGRYRECPNCGKARDGDTKFYMPQKRSYVSEETAKKINKNPDWVCDYCGEQLNSDNDKFCKSCGAPREGGNLNYHQYQEKKKVETERKAKQQEAREKTNTINSLPKTRVNWKIIISITLSILFVAGLVGIFIPKEREVTILELGWNREITVESLETFEENGWSLPSGARLRYTAIEFHHYEQVFDHYETRTREVAKERIVGYEDYVAGHQDLGNGYFEEIIASRPIYETYYEQEIYEEAVYRDEPVYQTKYYYDIDRWTYNKSIKTSGNDKNNVYWGEITLRNGEREGSRKEEYYANVVYKNGKEDRISFDFETWNTINVNEKIVVIIDSFKNAKVKK